jgi:hypothetical protein
MAKWITRDGLRLRVGSPGWRWWKKNRRAIEGNAAPIKKKSAPKHHPLTFEHRVVAFCHTALEYAGKMTYDEGALRSQLFHRKPGDFKGAHADCSQLVSSILHWCGVKIVTATDYTGTLLKKGKLVASPAPARVVIFGPGTGTHGAFITEKAGVDWWVVGFGHQGAPDRVRLSTLEGYFKTAGHPGVRYLDFSHLA